MEEKTKSGRCIGIVLVHGIGNQKRYDFLKEFATQFRERLQVDPGGNGDAGLMIRVLTWPQGCSRTRPEPTYK
jgi:hypothetical protein